MEHERQLDSSIACAEAKSSDDHSRLRGCKGFGHLAGWKALARAQGDVKMMRNGQFCKLTTDIYIIWLSVCCIMCVASGPQPKRFIPGMLCLVLSATTDSVQGLGPCVVQSPPWIFGGAERWTVWHPTRRRYEKINMKWQFLIIIVNMW